MRVDVAFLALGFILAASEASAAPPGEHAAQSSAIPDRPPTFPSRGPLPEATPGPDGIVYGYLAYWADDLQTVPWDDLSHLALFAASANTDGSLSNTYRWDAAPEALAIAEPYGVKVHLCFTNFDSSDIAVILGSADVRSTLVDNLADALEDAGADGINVDFEGVPESMRDELVLFLEELDAAVPEVYVATPSVDWSDAWNYAGASEHAVLFIMGYGYHYSGSGTAGPVDPLYGGAPWSAWSLQWTVEDYLEKGVDPERIVLGLPLYGYRWPTSSASVPAAATGSGTAVFWAEAQLEAATHGRNWDAVSHTPWYYDGAGQGWYSDVDSVRERVRYADDESLGGIGFWALNYDEGDAALWGMIHEETAVPTDGTPDPSEFEADAGQPFLAYVGDTVILSGKWSTGPADPLAFRWTQVAGPEMILDDPSAMEPTFEVTDPGTLVFALEVGDGTVWSAPARSHVVVLDPRDGRSRAACACAGVSPGGLSPVLLALAGLSLGRARGPARRDRAARFPAAVCRGVRGTEGTSTRRRRG